MNIWTSLLIYVRLLLYPLTILAFIMAGANEYTTTKNWRRITVLFSTVLLLSLLFVLSLLGLAGTAHEDITGIKDLAMTPIILLMCISIWAYVLKKSGKK